MENRIYNIAAFIILISISGCTEKRIMNQEQEPLFLEDGEKKTQCLFSPIVEVISSNI